MSKILKAVFCITVFYLYSNMVGLKTVHDVPYSYIGRMSLFHFSRWPIHPLEKVC